MAPVCVLTEVLAIEEDLADSVANPFVFPFSIIRVSLQSQLVWLIDCKDSQNEQLDHLTI